MSEATPAADTSRVGVELCLDFVNTVEARLDPVQDDKLNSYTDLLDWAAHTGIVTQGRRRRLLREAAQRPEQAHATFTQAVALREAPYRILSAGLQGQQAIASDLAILNRVLARARA